MCSHPPQKRIGSGVGKILSLYLPRWVATGGGGAGWERKTIEGCVLCCRSTLSASNVASWVSAAQLAPELKGGSGAAVGGGGQAGAKASMPQALGGKAAGIPRFSGLQPDGNPRCLLF